MNSIFFFIPFLLVASFGIYQDVFAVETYRGYDYQTITKPNGIVTSTHGLTPYIYNEQLGTYQPYIEQGNSILTGYGTVKLEGDVFYFYPSGQIGNNQPRFTDKIIGKYADISNLNSWTYPNTLNNDVPDVSFDGSALTSSKIKAGVGRLDYKYILNNGLWKTQLEVTNLSGLATKVFGFDQIIDISSDKIKFGGIERNLDNFNGTTFSKNFLDNNKGKVIDFMTGETFDFDIAYDSLYSVTVYDTGVNSSRLVFDYRGSSVLLPNETLILDPTYTSNNPTLDGFVEDAADNDTCDASPASASKTSTPTDLEVMVLEGAIANDCLRTFFDYDTSSIPDDATILDSDLTIDVKFVNSARNADVVSLNTVRGSDTALTIWNQLSTGTVLVSNNAFITSTGDNISVDLGDTANSEIQAKLASGYYTFGIKYTDESFDDTRHQTDIAGENDAGAAPKPTLTIVYQTEPPPYAVTDLTSTSHTASTIYLGWTAPYSGSASQSIIGYQINRTTPYSANPSTVYVNDTGSIATTYNVTGMTPGNNYSFRISAWTNNTGGHPFNNATGNIYNVPFWTPAVTTLDGTATAFTTVALDWTVPSSFSTILCYMINYTTPWGDPTTIADDCLVTTDTATVSELLVSQNYTFRVSPVTILGPNDTGNKLNVTTITNFELGALSDLDRTNTDDFSIFFERDDVNATHMFLNVTYPSSYDLLCDFDYQLARTNQTYGNLTSVSVGDGDVESAFLFINQTGDVIHVRCWDVSNADEAFYVITIQDFPLLGQIDNLRNGTYGTLFKIGLIDGVTLIVVILSMIGFNRTNPLAGIIFLVITIGVLSFFEIITYPIIMYPALAMLVVWAYISTRKDD